MKIHYKFIDEHQLLVQKAIGKWSIEYYIDYLEVIFKNEKILSVKKVLTDLREVDLQLAMQDMDRLMELRDQLPNLDYINVNIVNSPTSTVVSHVYQDKLFEKGYYDHHYCGIIRTAIHLLDLDITEDKMKALLNEMVEHL